jgi:hypothetical protein
VLRAEHPEAKAGPRKVVEKESARTKNSDGGGRARIGGTPDGGFERLTRE